MYFKNWQKLPSGHSKYCSSKEPNWPKIAKTADRTVATTIVDFFFNYGLLVINDKNHKKSVYSHRHIVCVVS